MGQEDEPAVPPNSQAHPSCIPTLFPSFLLSYQVSNSAPKPGSYNRSTRSTDRKPEAQEGSLEAQRHPAAQSVRCCAEQSVGVMEKRQGRWQGS